MPHAAAQVGHPLVHEPPAAGEVDPGALVLAPVDSHAEPEDEAATREELEGGRLLGHGAGTSQRQLEHAGPERRRGRGCGCDREGRHGLGDGMGPVQMVHGPERIGSCRFGPPAQLSQRRSTAGTTEGTTTCGSQFSLHGGVEG